MSEQPCPHGHARRRKCNTCESEDETARADAAEAKVADLQTALAMERGLRARREEALRRLIRGPHVIAHLYGCGARRDSEPCDCGADALYDEVAAALAK